jgi:hypothetical protein
VGVERVTHQRVALSDVMPVPAFGLQHPDLFAGVVRSNQGLLMVLDPAHLAGLAGGIREI